MRKMRANVRSGILHRLKNHDFISKLISNNNFSGESKIDGLYNFNWHF